jgi:DNA polymerase-3 subunit epsilon
LIQRLEPRFNRQSKSWRRYSYLKLTDERFPRLMVTRVMRADGAYYLGPFRSTAAAHQAREAIEDALPLRRCGFRIAKTAVLDPAPPCVPAQLGVATCPCRAQISDEEYGALAGTTRHALQHEPALLYGPLEARMHRLADAERFEEAALTRDRVTILSRALRRRRAMDAIRAAGRLIVDSAEGRVEIVHGRVVLDEDDPAAIEPPDLDLPPTREVADELLLVSRWLEQAKGVRCEFASGVVASRVDFA